jgi:GNAT superfamily N-acetyltransferase
MFGIIPCSVKKGSRLLLVEQLKLALALGAKEDGFDASKHMALCAFENGENGCYFITVTQENGPMCIGSLEWQEEDRFVRIFVSPLFRRRGAATQALRYVQSLVEADDVFVCECEISRNCKSGLGFVTAMGWEPVVSEDSVNVCMEISSLAEMQPLSGPPLSEEIRIAKVVHWRDHKEALLDLWDGEDDLFEEEEHMAIAWDGQLAVGSITWLEDMLMNLRVRPSYRKRGIGSALVRLALVDCFDHLGAKDVQIETVNPDAQRIYQSVGFRLLSEFDEYRISFLRKDNQ